MYVPPYKPLLVTDRQQSSTLRQSACQVHYQESKQLHSPEMEEALPSHCGHPQIPRRELQNIHHSPEQESFFTDAYPFAWSSRITAVCISTSAGYQWTEHTTYGNNVHTHKLENLQAHALPFLVPFMATSSFLLFFLLYTWTFLPFALCWISWLWLEVGSNVTPIDLVLSFLCVNSTLYTVEVNESCHPNVRVSLRKNLHTLDLSKPGIIDFSNTEFIIQLTNIPIEACI